MHKHILGIVAGYGFFVITSLLLFNFTDQRPHAQATTAFMLLAALYGIVVSLLSGYLAQWITGQRTLTVNYILAFIIAAFAAFSAFKASGSHWTQFLAILLFAPASIVGGWLRLRTVRNR